MVNSVLAVPLTGRIKRDEPRQYSGGQKQEASPSAFAQVLEEAVQETASAPREYRTVIYGKDLLLTASHYRTREYHY